MTSAQIAPLVSDLELERCSHTDPRVDILEILHSADTENDTKANMN